MKFSIYRIRVRVRVTPLRVTTVVRPVVRTVVREVRAKFVIVAMINRVVFVKQLSYTVKVI